MKKTAPWNMTSMATLCEIEIFRPGTWNNMTFTDADMVVMVNNSNRCRSEFRALLSLNHEEVVPEVIREAAFGVVIRYYLKRAADGVRAIFSDFENVPRELADLVKQFYPNRSIDLFEKFKSKSGQVLRNVIAGVSFLGSKMPPAVRGLFPDFVLTYHHDPALLALQSGVKTFCLEDNMKKKIKFEAAPVSVAVALQTKRAELGISEADMAAKITDPPVTEQTIRDLESGLVLPGESLLAALAQAYGIDAALLIPGEPAADVPAPDAAPMKQEPPPIPVTATPAISPEALLKMQDLEQQVAQMQQERDHERQAREAQDMQHFFERLETQHHASKLLTDPLVRTLAHRLDNTERISFAEGKQATSRQALLDVLERLAQSGIGVVPVGQVTTPPAPAKKFADNTAEARSLIEAYQKDNQVEYMQARLAVKGLRPELFKSAKAEE